MGDGAVREDLPSAKTAASPYDAIPKDKINTEPRQLTAKGILALGENRLDQASAFANQALGLDITNSYLQFLNGNIYHRQALAGDSERFALAAQGYELAIQFDPTNWIALYSMGLLRLDQRDYAEAQRFFAQAVLYSGEDPGVLYNLAVASYYAQDPETAAGALAKLRALGGYDKDPKVLRASSVVMAALNEPSQADDFLSRYGKAIQSPARQSWLSGRVADWNRFHQRYKDTILAQMVQTEPLPDLMSQDQQMQGQMQEQQFQEEQEQQSEEAEPAEPDQYQMVIVDVVIIRTEESIVTRKGINLLKGLTLQFGSSSASTAAFSYTKTRALPADSPGITRTVTRAINIPGITYSLNIVNASTTRNEILARPTLVALNGEPSEFFSGTEIDAAAVGGADSGSTISVQKEIGVTLNVTPEILEDGRVKLAVVAERTFLTTPNTTSITFTLRIDVSKTKVTANVVMNFGETLILSGLSEKETERKRDGVPGLQDIPLIQYFFSQRDTTDFQKSVLILLTPRRPKYIHRSEKARKNAQKSLSKEERVLTELQARYSDWFRPYPNWASVFHHMQANKLYREFRTGDVALEKWENQESRENRLKQALDFLYF